VRRSLELLMPIMILSATQEMIGGYTGARCCSFTLALHSSCSQLPLLHLSPLSSCFGHRGKQTFGRWSRKDGKAVFVAGIPPPFSAFKQPVLELFSWQEFAENGRDVRVAI
jgi:hypothetical protein